MPTCGIGPIVTNWLVLIVAIAVLWVGTRIGVAREEALLGAEFGEEFERYKREVPSLILWMRK